MLNSFNARIKSKSSSTFQTQRSPLEHSAVYPQQAGQGQSLLQHRVLKPLVHIQVVTH